jgi:hypothetical protein
MHFSTNPPKPDPTLERRIRLSPATITLVNRIAGGIGMLAGTALIVLAFFAVNRETQLLLGFMGFALLAGGVLVFAVVPLAWTRRLRAEDERYERVMAKLDEIQETLKTLEEKPPHSGVAVADLFGAGMKWYQDYRQGTEKDTDKDA